MWLKRTFENEDSEIYGWTLRSLRGVEFHVNHGDSLWHVHNFRILHLK